MRWWIAPLTLLPGGFLALAAVGVLSPSLRQAWTELVRRAWRWVRVWWELQRLRRWVTHARTVTYLKRPRGLVNELVGYCDRCKCGWYAFDPLDTPEECPSCQEELL